MTSQKSSSSFAAAFVNRVSNNHCLGGAAAATITKRVNRFNEPFVFLHADMAACEEEASSVLINTAVAKDITFKARKLLRLPMHDGFSFPLAASNCSFFVGEGSKKRKISLCVCVSRCI